VCFVIDGTQSLGFSGATSMTFSMAQKYCQEFPSTYVITEKVERS
jgi:hypothetical protein